MDKKENKTEPGRGNYQSKHKIDDLIDLNCFESGRIKNCKIHAVRFTIAKVKYDVAVLIVKPDEENKEGKWTILKNVDSAFVEAPEDTAGYMKA